MNRNEYAPAKAVADYLREVKRLGGMLGKTVQVYHRRSYPSGMHPRRKYV